MAPATQFVGNPHYASPEQTGRMNRPVLSDDIRSLELIKMTSIHSSTGNQYRMNSFSLFCDTADM